MIHCFDLEGVQRVAGLFLSSHRPADRGQAIDLVFARYGAYDLDRDTLIASVDAYFKTVSA